MEARRLHGPVRVQTPAQPRLWGEHKSDTGGAVRSFCCLLCLLRLLYIHYAEDFPLKQVQQSVHWDSWTFGLSIVDWIWRFKFKCFVVYWTLLFYKQGFNPINGKFSFWRVIIGFISVFGHFRKRIVTLCVINQPKKSLCILKYFCLCPTLHRSFQNAPNFFKIWQILVVLYKPSLKFEVDRRYVKC